MKKLFCSDYSGSGPLSQNGGNVPYSRRESPFVPQQRQPPALLPRLRHYGGCSRICRRFLWHKIRNAAAAPVLAAVHFGSKTANSAMR
jgi:hypothetical protein